MIDAAISVVVHGGFKAQRTLQLKRTLAGNVQVDLFVEADGVGDELPSLRELARQQRLEGSCYDIIFDGVADGDTRGRSRAAGARRCTSELRARRARSNPERHLDR